MNITYNIDPRRGVNILVNIYNIDTHFCASEWGFPTFEWLLTLSFFLQCELSKEGRYVSKLLCAKIRFFRPRPLQNDANKCRPKIGILDFLWYQQVSRMFEFFENFRTYRHDFHFGTTIANSIANGKIRVQILRISSNPFSLEPYSSTGQFRIRTGPLCVIEGLRPLS